MSMFSSLLPKPTRSEYTRPISLRKQSHINENVLILPLNQNNEESVISDAKSNPNRISKYFLNKDGTLNYNKTIASQHLNRKFHSSYEDTIPLKQRFPNLKHHFPKLHLDNCDDDTVKECITETKNVIALLLDAQSGNNNSESTSFVNYTSSNIVDENERGRERQIQIQSYKEDPMLPPKHKLRKNRHKEPSPPPPILKKTGAETLTKEDHAKWNIPAAVSNWKNNQGFTISLDKRMRAAVPQSTPTPNLKKLSDLTSALDQADEQARKDIKIRNEIRKDMLEKQQREKEEKLKELAELTRNKRDRRYHHDPYDNNKRTRY